MKYTKSVQERKFPKHVSFQKLNNTVPKPERKPKWQKVIKSNEKYVVLRKLNLLLHDKQVTKS